MHVELLSVKSKTNSDKSSQYKVVTRAEPRSAAQTIDENFSKPLFLWGSLPLEMFIVTPGLLKATATYFSAIASLTP